MGQDALLETGRDCRVIVGHHGADQVADVRVWGDARVDAEGTLDLTALGGVRIRCGDSVISVMTDHIELKSKRVSLVASEELIAQGDGPTLHLSDRAELNADDVRLHGSASSVRLDSEARIKSNAIKLQSGSDSVSQSSASATPETRRIDVRAVDDSHRTLANRKYQLRVQGQTLEGTTDGDGVVSVDVPRDARIVTLTVWPDDPPKRRALSWDLRVSELASAESLAGAQQRLSNLGLYHGAAHGEVDGATRKALREFQRIQGLSETGELDDDTRSKLSHVPDRTPST